MSEKTITPLSKEDQVYAQELIWKLEGTICRVVRSYLDVKLSFEFEDIVQGIYEQICKQLGDFKTCNNPYALAATIAARAVWRIQRKWKPTEELAEDIPAAEENRGLAEILPSSISDADKELLTSVYERQDTMVELSADLGCSAPTLRQRLKRARARLRKEIEENT